MITPARVTAQRSIPLGEKFEGELGGKPVFQGGGSPNAYVAAIPVVLKAGQSVAISVTVTGKTRQIRMRFLEPTGKVIGASEWSTKSGQLNVEEVPASGKYTIVVMSDLIGPFTLLATDPTDEKQDAKELQDRILKLEAELANLKAKLKERQAKEKKERQ
jgi:hypothetical protein